MKILNERVGFVCAWGYFQEPGGWDTCVLYNILYACWACLVESDSLQPHGLSPTGLFYPWNFPGNTGVGCHFLLQGIFLSQGSNPRLLCLLHCQMQSLPLVLLGKPKYPL